MSTSHITDLNQLARQALLERGFDPDFSEDVQHELSTISHATPYTPELGLRDLRGLLWCSIDNPDSRDLDQLTYAEQLPQDVVRIYVAVADVDSIVRPNSAIDKHAATNTTSIYTPSKIFPMLPEKLSTNLTSLNPAEDRLATIVSIAINPKGGIEEHDVYQGWVRNKAKLNYPSISAWLEGQEPLPEAAAKIEGVEAQLRLQDSIAQLLQSVRESHGALSFGTIETDPIIEDETVIDIRPTPRGRADELIENFMIAANTATCQFLKQRQFPIVRRIVRTPLRWERIVSVAAEVGEKLPWHPDGKALEQMLLSQKERNPQRFPDLSLTIIKLLGRGEYVVDFFGDRPIGHFGLAVRDYTHSTAPNRRYPDLITQRLTKAALQNKKIPYTKEQLIALAAHCTDKEDDAEKVERKLKKSAAALMLKSQIGKVYEGFITGSSEKGVWVRIARPAIEGKVVRGEGGLDVGDRVKVKLIYTDVANAYIDFARA